MYTCVYTYMYMYMYMFVRSPLAAPYAEEAAPYALVQRSCSGCRCREAVTEKP